VVEAFAQVVKRLPSPLLLQLRHHFQSRPTDHPFRVVFPKGEVGKIRAVEPPPLSLDASLCSRMETLCQEALLALYAQRPSLGPCWLDDQLKRYTVPFALRSASKALRTVARGSRLPFCAPGEAVGPRETMRFFIWWRDGKSRTDLDLSALVLDDDFQFQTDLAYYNLKELGGYHSGDITSAPEGASEFIDIEIDTFAGRGARYVMMVVNSFTTQPYCDLPECFAGFMRRNAPQSGEVYEPRTLIHKFDLTANSTIAIPLILDLREREVIWTDLSLKRNPSRVNNVRGNRSSLSLLCEAMVNLSRPSLHDLFGLHVLARGQAAGDPEQAQTRFQAEPAPGAITPYDIPLIMAEYL
jgi:stress response protein SCP2